MIHPKDATVKKEYKDGKLVSEQGVEYIGLDHTGDYLLKSGEAREHVSPKCFPEHSWMSGPTGDTKMKTVFEV